LRFPDRWVSEAAALAYPLGGMTFAELADSLEPARATRLEARALGGTNAAENLRVRCRAHNRLAAEEMFGKAHVAEQIDFRQRKSPSVARPVVAPSPPPSQVIELALRGLHNLGFKKSDARRALEEVSHRRAGTVEQLDVQELLRGAIAALT
jgi:hypothetical protein